jgi:aspartate oxidase
MWAGDGAAWFGSMRRTLSDATSADSLGLERPEGARAMAIPHPVAAPPGRDFLVIGSGVAGLLTALKAARHGSVVLATKRTATDSNSNYAQGGIAAVTSPLDSFEQHVADTLQAGAGICRREVVEAAVRAGPAMIRELMEIGAQFSSATPSSSGAKVATRRIASCTSRIRPGAKSSGRCTRRCAPSRASRCARTPWR